MNNFFEKYYNINKPYSFTGLDNFYKSLRRRYDISKQSVENWLRKQETYGVHYPYNIKFHRNPVVARHIDDIWQVDLIFVLHPPSNENYKYILVVIDVLSKFVWVRLLENKKSMNVTNALDSIIVKSKRKPYLVISDSGREFRNRLFERYLENNNIHHYISYDTTKATVVERFNRTLKDRILKYLTYKRTKKYVHILDKIVNGYNHTVHSRTKFKPISVKKKNEKQVYQNLYKIKTTQERQKYEVGDKVRAAVMRSHFEKGYKPSYSRKIYRIARVLNVSPYYKYVLRDSKNIEIRGSFYAKELMSV